MHYGKQHTYEGSQPHGHGLCDHHYIIYNISGSGVKDHTYGKYPICTYAPEVVVPRMCVTTKNNGIYLICHSHIESKGIREIIHRLGSRENLGLCV